MKQVWLNKKNNESLIVFFNGWGMDERIVHHLDKEDNDILVVYDYRTIEKLISLDSYKYKNLIAWSMGVFMSNICDLSFNKSIAINGTLKPIDIKYGINPKIYDLTINNFNELTKVKFAKNMGVNYELSRTNEELKEELIAIKNYNFEIKSNFDTAFISKNDKIFSLKAQNNFWNDNNVKTVYLDCGHYVFNDFKSWSDILNV